MPNLTTHVLDISSGKPAETIKIELFKLIEGSMQKINEIHTNSDGRSPNPLLNDDNDDNKGVYELHFHAGDYFENRNIKLPDIKFLDIIIIRFGINDASSHYHVPLLVSHYGYSTYRGS